MKITFLAALTIWILALAGCARYVKTDLASLRQNPEQYENATVIIATDLQSLRADQGTYQPYMVEVTGYVGRQSPPSAMDWGFTLVDEQGNTLDCYEHEYRYYPYRLVVLTLLKAEKNHEPITVVGSLKSSTEPMLELDWIEYRGRRIDTNYNYRPPPAPIPPGFSVGTRP